MSIDTTRRQRLELLRQRAMNALSRGTQPADQMPAVDAHDLHKLLEELRVYQTELEIQNQELVEAQAQAHGLLQRYTSLFGHSPVPALVLNGQGHVLEANDSARHLFGLRQLPLMQYSIYRLLADRDEGTMAQLLREAGEHTRHAPSTALVCLRTLASPSHPFEAHLHTLPPLDASAPQGAMFVLQLVDRAPHEALEQRQRELEASEARWRSLFEQTRQAILLLHEGIVVDANPAAVRLFEVVHAQDLIDHRPSEFAPPWQTGGQSSSDVLEQALQAALDSGTARIDFDLQTRGGRRLTMQVHLTRIVWSDRVMVLSLWSDITAQLRIEREQDARRRALEREVTEHNQTLENLSERLRQSDSQRDTLLETATSGMALVVGEMATVTNQRFNEMMGYADHGLTGQPTRLWFADDASHARFVADCAAACVDGGTYRAVTACRRRDGTTLWARLTGHALDSRQPALGTVLVVDDISLEREALDSLEHARTLAEQASALKSALMANVSHELRTPLNAIIGFGELLAATGLDERQRGFVAQIRGSTRLLLEHINDLLDFSHLDADTLTLELRPITLRRTLQHACQGAADRARAKGLTFELQIAPEVPDHAIGDPKRLQQLLRILLNNAVKFTDRGHVRVAVRRVSDAGDTVTLHVAVADSGIGIEPALRERLFQAFEQGDGSSRRRHGGMGLGLSMAKSLAECMGGAIGVDSTPGGGTTFWFTLTLMTPGTAHGRPAEATPHDAEAALAEADPPATAAGDDDPPTADSPAPDGLEELTALLERSDASALPRCERMAPALKAWLRQDYPTFQRAVATFDFEAAAHLLHAARAG